MLHYRHLFTQPVISLLTLCIQLKICKRECLFNIFSTKSLKCSIHSFIPCKVNHNPCTLILFSFLQQLFTFVAIIYYQDSSYKLFNISQIEKPALTRINAVKNHFTFMHHFHTTDRQTIGLLKGLLHFEQRIAD